MSKFTMFKNGLSNVLNKTNRKEVLVGGAMGVMMVVVGVAVASTAGAEFQGFYDKVLGWTDGYLGKGLAILALLWGLGSGWVKGTVAPAVLGIAVALFATIGPTVINGMFTSII